eukprot:1140615-Pelagomonas_calceolata.AAC.7
MHMQGFAVGRGHNGLVDLLKRAALRMKKWVAREGIEHRAQPPSCYGALVKREEDDSKEEVPGLNPCGQGGEKMPSIGGSQWEGDKISVLLEEVCHGAVANQVVARALRLETGDMVGMHDQPTVRHPYGLHLN